MSPFLLIVIEYTANENDVAIMFEVFLNSIYRINSILYKKNSLRSSLLRDILSSQDRLDSLMCEIMSGC